LFDLIIDQKKCKDKGYEGMFQLKDVLKILILKQYTVRRIFTEENGVLEL
jgi:hypothetical protein